MDYEHVARERNKARALKQTQWWKSKKSQGKCHYCKNLVKPAALTMDHKVPVSRGGKSSRSNVVPCCKDCNVKKQYYTPVEWPAGEKP